MRWGGSAWVAVLVVAACDGAEVERGDVSAPRPASAAPAGSVRLVPEPVAPEPTAVEREVDRLVALWCESSERNERDCVVARLAALGTDGLPRLVAIVASDVEDDDLADLLIDVVRAVGDDAVPILAKLVREGTGTARRVAATHAPWTWPWLETGPAFARALLQALNDPDVETRKAVIEQLARAAPTGVDGVGALLGRLGAEDPAEVCCVLDAFGEMGASARPAMSRVIDLVVDADPGVRSAANEKVRDSAAWTLEGIGPGTKEDAERLVGLLRDERLGETAADALTMRPELVEPHLAELLSLVADGTCSDHVDPLLAAVLRVPSAAASVRETLPALPPEQIVAILGAAGRPLRDVAAEYLTFPDAEVRLAAVRCLTEEGDDPDPAAIRPLLEDADPAVRAAAARVLVNDEATRERALAVAGSLLGRDGAEPDAVRAFALAGAAAVEAKLVPLLASESSSVREAVVDALQTGTGPLGRAPAGSLERLLEDALGKYGDPGSAAVVVRFDGGADALVAGATRVLDGSSDEDAIRLALDSLARAGAAARGAAAPVERFRDGATDWRLRERAGEVLGELTGDPVLLANSCDATPEAARRLLALGRPGAAALVAAAGDWAHWAVTRAITGLGETAPEQTLADAIADAAAVVGSAAEATRARRGAAKVASVLGDSRGVAAAARLLGDPDAGVREAAAVSLARLGDARADLATAAEALERALSDEEPEVRRDAIPAARRVGPLAKDVHARLADEDASVRLQAAGAVLAAAPGDGEARRALLEALDHARSDDALADADWACVGGALQTIALDARDVPTLSTALREIHDCGVHVHLLRALARLGPAAAPALPSIRLALADQLRCDWGSHLVEYPLAPAALAALTAIGPPAAAALPDLRAMLAEGDPEHLDAVRAAIRAIESPPR